jgi:hypothetical protein
MLPAVADSNPRSSSVGTASVSVTEHGVAASPVLGFPGENVKLCRPLYSNRTKTGVKLLRLSGASQLIHRGCREPSGEGGVDLEPALWPPSCRAPSQSAKYP